VIRAFSAIQQSHNLNLLCSAVLPKEFCDGYSEHG